MNGLAWHADPLWVIAGVCAVAAIGVLGLISVRRSHLPGRAAVAEILRVALAAGAVVTILQPEFTTSSPSRRQSEITILRDASASMTTRDMPGASGGEDRAVSRRRWLDDSGLEREIRELSARQEIRQRAFDDPERAGEDPGGPEGTNLLAALEQALEGAPGAVVLVSDGDWNLGGSPLRAAGRFQLAGVPLFVLGIGSESPLPDIEISRVAAPNYAIAGEPVRLPVQITSRLATEVSTSLELRSAAGVLARESIAIPPLESLDIPLVWTPQEEGTWLLRLEVPVQAEETVEDNNHFEFSLNVRRERIRVLLVDSLPRWDYRYLRNALLRDPGVEVDCVLYHPHLDESGRGERYLDAFPSSPETLSLYDVVFLGDVGLGSGELDGEGARHLRGLIEQQGSGLVFLPGPRGRHLSFTEEDLGDLYPVLLDPAHPQGEGRESPSRLILTPAGNSSLLTMLAESGRDNPVIWKHLPGFYWHAPVTKSKAGAEVLAVHEAESNAWGRLPLLVTRPFGQGKVLFLGIDGAWRWRRGFEDKYHYRFWGQVARWMAYQRHMASGDRARISFLPERPRAGDVLSLRAALMTASGAPLQEAVAYVEITGPSGTPVRKPLEPAGGLWGIYTGNVRLSEAGEFRLVVSAPDAGLSHELTISTAPAGLEKVGQPAVFDEVRQLADQTGGAFYPAAAFGQLFQRLESLPPPPPVVRTTALWAHPLWLGFLLCLFVGFWLARRRAGTI